VRRQRYLQLPSGPALTVVHSNGTSAPTAAVLLVPPFGWEETFTYRQYLHWADALAQAGYPAMRIDLPGTCDSAGSSRQPGLFASWLEAISLSAASLRASSGAPRVVALGVGLGGMLAYCSLAAGAPIDDLVLWAVPSRGSAMLREMRAFAGLVIEANPGLRPTPATAPAPDDPPEFAGLVLAADTVEAIAALDLTGLEIPRADERRLLLIGRGTLPVDKRLAEHARRSGAEVTTTAGLEYATMMEDPAYATAPRETYAMTNAWLDGGSGDARTEQAPDVVAGTEDAELTVDGVAVRESQVEAVYEGLRMYGIAAEPAGLRRSEAPFCAVLFTPGANRRVGPQRMWVDVARRWAARGIPTVRIDLASVGESDGPDGQFTSLDSFYREELTTQALATIDALERLGFPPRFLLGGLCSGGFWSFQSAVRDDRVRALLLLMDTDTLYRSRLGWAHAEVPMRHYARRTLALLARGRITELARLAREDARLERVGHGLERRLRRRLRMTERLHRSSISRVDATFAALEDRGVSTYMVVDEAERTLRAAGRSNPLEPWPGVRAERMNYCLHSIGPVVTQVAIHAAIDRALDRALEREAAVAEQHVVAA
jgi:alpha-beta hydrolase superfamily lysophospholipase